MVLFVHLLFFCSRIRVFNMRRLHPDVLGAAKLNMLREFGKFVPLNHDKEGPQLQEAEVLYNTAVRLRG
jgi:hypothetical protein